MNLAALVHQCRFPYAYPVGETHLRVVLKAARGDLARATCVYGDRYAWPPDADAVQPLQYLGSDGLHDYWGATLPAPRRRVRYLFYLEGADGSRIWLTERGPCPRRPRLGHFQYPYIHRADTFRQPEWIRGAVFYEIFPDRFDNGDPGNDPPGCLPWGAPPTREGMAGGDLAGIRRRLDYLRDLGVTCLYLTPIFKAPSNHKYDTADYYHVDPAFGTEAELRELVAAAHRRGIRVILDGVFNHAGAQWPPFRDVVAKGPDSPYVGWFYQIHSFPVDPAKVNYETWGPDVATLPKVDTSHPEVAAYFLAVAEHWIREAGIDGWRLDVANEVNHGFWRRLRERVKALRPDAFLLGEIWHDASDWLQGDQFDSVMNYPWREAVVAFLTGELDPVEFDRHLTRLRFQYPGEVLKGLVNLLGSHDTPRIRTVLGSREGAALAAVLLFTAEGVPMVYYGDEIGLEGGEDPDCRRCYPWDDPAGQDRGLLSLYRRLGAIRRRFPWLNDGAWETFVADPVRGVLGFCRRPTPLVSPEPAAGEEGLYVVVNRSAAPVEVTLPTGSDLVDLLAGEMLCGRLEGRTLALPAYGAAVVAPRSLLSPRPGG
ncbi:MAG: glycoside hydrolase family 13 protein [Bacillota bacterium]